MSNEPTKELYVFFNDYCQDYKEHEPVIDEFDEENPDIVVTKFNFTNMSYPPTTYHVEKYSVSQSPTYIGVVSGKEIDRQSGGKPSKFVLKSLLG